jgi:hypothetical protein
MAVPLILCRLKDDHSVVHEIGETALIYFPDWEPVPTEQRLLIEAENNMTAPPDPEPETDEGKRVAGQKPPAKKAAAPAAKDKE